MKLPTFTIISKRFTIRQIFLLFTAFAFLPACEIFQSENVNYDWKDISISNNTDLTHIQMLDNNVGYTGGLPKIDSFIYESGVDLIVGGRYYDTLIFQNDEHPIVYYNLIRTVPSVPEPCLYKTENGGESWIGMNTPFKSGMLDFNFVNEDVGFVLTLKEGVFKTTNGGLSWVKIAESAFTTGYGVWYTNPFDAIGVQSVSHIYLLNRQQHLILESKDSGSSWRCISKGTPQLDYTFYHPEACYFKTNSDTGYIKTSTGMHRTFNNGESWEFLQEELMINDLVVDGSKMYLTSSSNIYISYDYGETVKRVDMVGALSAGEFELFNDSLIYFTDAHKYENPHIAKTTNWGGNKTNYDP